MFPNTSLGDEHQNEYSYSTDFSSNDKNTNVLNEKLTLASLNVCGLKRRLMYPEFKKLVNKYDIFGAVETKLDVYDVIELENYIFSAVKQTDSYFLPPPLYFVSFYLNKQS